MAIDERLTYLETRLDEHSEAIRELRGDIRRLEEKFELRFDAIDRRFEAIDRKFEAIDRRFEAIDHRFEILTEKFDQFRSELWRDRRGELRWIIGLQITTMIAVVTAILSR